MEQWLRRLLLLELKSTYLEPLEPILQVLEHVCARIYLNADALRCLEHQLAILGLSVHLFHWLAQPSDGIRIRSRVLLSNERIKHGHLQSRVLFLLLVGTLRIESIEYDLVVVHGDEWNTSHHSTLNYCILNVKKRFKHHAISAQVVHVYLRATSVRDQSVGLVADEPNTKNFLIDKLKPFCVLIFLAVLIEIDIVSAAYNSVRILHLLDLILSILPLPLLQCEVNFEEKITVKWNEQGAFGCNCGQLRIKTRVQFDELLL